MKFQEIEELLYTDAEVRQQMEVRRLRVRAERRPGSTLSIAEHAGDPATNKARERKAEDLCPSFASARRRPLPTGASTDRQSAWPQS